MNKLQYLTASDFPQMEKLYRARLINSLSGFKSVNLCGTADAEGHTNLAIVSSVVHFGADPALMGFVMRPVTVTRDTYNNIMKTHYFTLNHITSETFQQAHQSSARYESTISEFDATGLTALLGELHPAPYVAESPVRIGLRYREHLDIRLNGTILIIGEVVELYFPENCLFEDGYLDIEKAGTITVSGLDGYHSTQKLDRLSYAKPYKELHSLPFHITKDEPDQ